MQRTTTVDADALKARLDGDVYTPADADWDEARSSWNLVADSQPAAVAYVESAADAAAVVDFARESGIGVATQGTGHGSAPRGPLGDAILVKTERMNGVEIDPDSGVGRFEAGVIWRDALNAAGEHGLAGPAGSSPDVGVIGYTLGGGFGWLSRRFGLACNWATAIELVTADGEQRRVDADNEPELFWALRGGGGSFGLVTALELQLQRLPEVYAGSVIVPADERSREIFGAWRDWAAQVPDEVTSIARFLHLPPLPQVPEPLRDRPLITLGACYAGPPAEGEELIRPLQEIAGEAIMDMFAPMPPAGLVQVHMDPEEPVPGLVHGAMLRELPDEALDAFVENAGPDSGSPLLMVEIRQAGGATAQPADGAGALSHLDAGFVMNGVGLPMAPGMAEAIEGHADRVCSAVEPWTARTCYFNFTERPVGVEAIFAPETLRRLIEVKHSWDGDDLFRANHPIPTAG